MAHHTINVFAYEKKLGYNSTCQQKYENIRKDAG